MKTEQCLSVGTLIKYVLSSGDLDRRFSGPSRLIEGIHAHQKIQKNRPEVYVREVPVSRDFEMNNFLLTINGRMDGVYQYPDRVIIDEIKTTRQDLEHIDQEEDSQAYAQVKCYAYLYGEDLGLEEIDTQLTYYQVDTGVIREIRRTYTLADLEVFFRDILDRYLEWANTVYDWSMKRNQSIQDLEFPFDTYRSGQRAMAVEVYRSVEHGNQLIVQASTGIGKTMAALFPPVKAMAEGLTTKIFYLTAKTTARTSAERALEELRKRGLKIKSLTLTARDKICLRPGSACSGEECEFAESYFDRIQGIVKGAFKHDAFTRELIETVARENRVCPFELSLDLSLWVDCIICDYNYVFDPRVYLKRFFQDRNTRYTLLVDEAHNLADRGREMFSSEIRKQPFLEMKRSLKADLPALYKRINAINSWFIGARKQCEMAGNALFERERPDELIPLLRDFAREAERWLLLNSMTHYHDKLLDLYFDVINFLKISEGFDECYTTCTDRSGRDLRLKLFCIDPSKHLKNRLKQFGSAVFFSATLTPLDYFKRILGCEDSAKVMKLPSPFPVENLCVVISGTISTLYRHRDRTTRDVASAIFSVIKSRRGRYLIFFPSYEYMMTVYLTFRAYNHGMETIIQEPGMTENDRDLFLARFTGENSRTLVGFVVMGGVFSEGIDLVGENLSGAVIVGVGLPGISPERQIIRSHFDELGEGGFAYAYAYPGMNRVLQAAGRVIRSHDDRGVILLVDKRFLTHEYRSLLPREWTPVTVANNAQLQETLEKFWGT